MIVAIIAFEKVLFLKVRQIRNYFSSRHFFQKTNAQIRLYYLLTCFRLFFGRKWRTPKRHFKINLPLVGVNLTLVCSKVASVFANLKYKVVQMCNVRLILVVSSNCKIEAACQFDTCVFRGGLGFCKFEVQSCSNV